MPKKKIEAVVEAVAPEVKPQKPALSGVTFPIFNSLIRFNADLLAVARVDKSAEFKMICPDCKDANKLSQRYICDAGHGPFTESEAHRGKEVGKDQLHKVDQEQIDEVRAVTLPAKTAATLAAFDAKEVEAQTFPGKNAYKLRLVTELDQQLAASLLPLLKDTKTAYLTELVLRSSQKMYRMREFNGQIVLQELVRPSEMAETDQVIKAKADKSATATLKTLQTIDVFDTAVWSNQVKVRAIELNERLVADAANPKKKAKKGAPAPQNALADMLASALSA